MTSKQVFLDTPLLKRGGAGKRKGNRSPRRSMSPAGRAWWNGAFRPMVIEVVTDGRVYGFRGPILMPMWRGSTWPPAR